MKTKSIPSLIAALTLAVAAPALAADDNAPTGEDGSDKAVEIDRTAPPKELAQATVKRVLSALDGRRDELKRNPEELYALVDELVTPLIDIDYTAKLVLGPHWRDASPEQRERFTKAFKAMLMRTYADALVQFKEQEIEYLPLEQNEAGDRATLRAEIQTQAGETMQVALSLREVEDKISDLREQLTIASAKLDRTRITAPQDGVVQNLSVHTLGAVIRPGDDIMQVIPVQDKLIIEAEVMPNDIDIVGEGQVADVRLTALQSRTTPTLKGTVTGISADRILAAAVAEACPIGGL